MADDRYFHRLHRTGHWLSAGVFDAYISTRDVVLADWPGAARSSATWSSARSRRRLERARTRLGDTGWQWTGWLLSPRFPIH